MSVGFLATIGMSVGGTLFSVCMHGGRCAIDRLTFLRLQTAEASFNRSGYAFFDHIRRQAVERTLERVARINVLAVNPSFAILPVNVVAQQHFIELVYVGLIRKHDVS